MRYAAQVREQTGRKEFITDLAGMAETLIRAFIKANRNNKPETIVMFRDGVSEGQWAPVVHSEVSALKAAFRAIDQAWSPKLTYIVCMKRHNVRFFSSDPKNTDRTGNLVPGVVVDRHVTHPYVFDFFRASLLFPTSRSFGRGLLADSELDRYSASSRGVSRRSYFGTRPADLARLRPDSLKGTARPTRYVVLLDENKYSSDELQKMTKSVSFRSREQSRPAC